MITIRLNVSLFILCLFIFAISSVKNEVKAKENTQSLMVIGYDGEYWYPYVTNVSENEIISKDSWRKVGDIQDPAYLTRHPATGAYYIKGNDGELYHYNAQTKKLELLNYKKSKAIGDNFTQLRASENGVVMVRLVGGKSRDTQLLNLKQKNNSVELKIINDQASAQFHPFDNKNTIYYSNVTCRSPCNPLIQEIWKYNKSTGRSEQLTLLNSISYLHSISNDNRYGYIVSNYHGFYQIASLDLKDRTIKWLTDGPVTDSYPCITNNNSLFFIRRNERGTNLMFLKNIKNKTKGTVHQVDLPEGVKKIRYLELS